MCNICTPCRLQSTATWSRCSFAVTPMNAWAPCAYTAFAGQSASMILLLHNVPIARLCRPINRWLNQSNNYHSTTDSCIKRQNILRKGKEKFYPGSHACEVLLPAKLAAGKLISEQIMICLHCIARQIFFWFHHHFFSFSTHQKRSRKNKIKECNNTSQDVQNMDR